MNKTDICKLIYDILNDVQDCDNIGNDTLLMKEGILDSMSILHLIYELEEKFKISIPLEDVIEENFKTIDAISDFILTRTCKD